MRRVVIPGLLGGLVLVLWTVLVNGLIGFRSRIDLNTLPEERRVYEMLRRTVSEPGRYAVNPAATPRGGFPDGEPVFGVSYAGFGHEAAGKLALLDVGIALVTSILAAAMLSITSRRVLSSYLRKVLFFTVVGLLFALFRDLRSYGIGGYPFDDAIILAADSVITWTVVGLVVALRMKPPPEALRASVDHDPVPASLTTPSGP